MKQEIIKVKITRTIWINKNSIQPNKLNGGTKK